MPLTKIKSSLRIQPLWWVGRRFPFAISAGCGRVLSAGGLREVVILR